MKRDRERREECGGRSGTVIVMRVPEGLEADGECPTKSGRTVAEVNGK